MPTKIEWTDETWNPITGCSHVSAGCANCYAERLDRRQMMPGRKDGFRPWTAQNAKHNVRLHSERMGQPLVWKKPRRVFVCSMSDLFHERVPYSYVDDVFCVMAEASRHTFQILTKRPQRMLDYIKSMQRDITQKRDPDWTWPLPNVWFGVSAEDQRTFDERILLLLQTPAAKRFVSLEPLLGPIKIDRGVFSYLWDGLPNLDWVIVGGESGPDARPMHPDWVRSIRDQCQAAGVPWFFKQHGDWLHESQFATDEQRAAGLASKRMDDGDGYFQFVRVGKKRAGRELDGRAWEEFPA